MVLYGRIILWHKWLVLRVWRQIVLFCPHFWCSRIGLGGTAWNGEEQEQARGWFFFGRPWNTVAPSAIYFSVLVIMEQSKLPTALKGSLPQQPHCLQVHQPSLRSGWVSWSLTAITSTGWRPPQTRCLRAIRMPSTRATEKCGTQSIYKF